MINNLASLKHTLTPYLLLILLTGCGSSHDDTGIASKAELGERLFSDQNLSLDRTQSCATCHSPEHGFVDNRINATYHNIHVAAGSLGDDGVSIGDRNAPTAAYAAFSPTFKYGTRARVQNQSSDIAAYSGFLGGQFWDGRANDLAAQAGGPPLNPGEMNMPNKAAVIERIQENTEYVEAFERLFNNQVFSDVETAYDAMAEVIGEFEFLNRETFYPFDSKYDLSLTGEYSYDPNSKASLGKVLFFGSDFTCAACHQLREIGVEGELFTSFEYHNIGVPENTRLRAINGVTEADLGLFNNPEVNKKSDAIAHQGKFKVPTLRNVAITPPYMHNGVFNQLETVITFYEHAKLRALNLTDNTLNPETGLTWAEPEVNLNIEHDTLGKNDKNLTPENIEALVCFFMSLTDARYEHLLDSNKVTACGL
ncbi:cytochrome-c peroxidase [Bermanella sp. WJH001]|uniref:cytochrome-c peroxidase n=1 Tax=Bermanella sp. WJH001 TaxID=3048005 RepID=UPI0024BED297|nr:cytochrome c peroxidase [Bermanella sp. WJH001]MDJ1538592.1 cytochrome c peroxidase [Bermanella sp. WJH001]